ncbi:MAG: A/G-specific adenine glycosylase [Desulfobacterales bacterium]|jgi:A/G-specific adenine glycosylase
MKAKNIRQLQSKLLLWYKTNQRPLPWRKTDDPYRIWVSEVMLQQTQVNTVLPFYRDFFLQFPNVKFLARADINSVLKAWEGMGYYARARNLHRAAKTVVEKHDGKIPDSWHDFRKLPGVGDYIGSAVLSIAFHQPYAVVDGNVKRVIARLLQIDAAVNKSASYKIFKEACVTLLDPKQPGMFNQAVMELGALICKPKNPNCGICPVQIFCRAYQFQTVNEYPKRIKNRPRPDYHIAVGVVFKNTHLLITRRKLDGLLGGLWEFPGGKVRNGESAETACVREIREEVNISVEVSSFLTRVKHAYTHFKIHADVFCCNYLTGNVKLNGPIDYLWIKLQDIDRYPFPKANHKFIPLLKQMNL